MPIRSVAAHRARLAALGALAVAADVAFDPSHTHLPLCPFHAVTGLLCPLCGGLRAVNHLARGNVRAAMTDNVIVVIGAGLLGVWLMLGDPQRAMLSGSPRRRQFLIVTAIAVLSAFTIARNIPSGVESSLRPA